MIGAGWRKGRGWTWRAVASSDELNNKRCKYDNFSQDVASNNKIKVIPCQRQKSPSQVPVGGGGKWAWWGSGLGVFLGGLSVTRALRVVISWAQENIHSSHPSCGRKSG